MFPGTVRGRGRGRAPPAMRALLSARVSPYFGISSSRAGQPLLTDSRGNLPRPLLAGCVSAYGTRWEGGEGTKRLGRASSFTSGSGRVWSFFRPGATLHSCEARAALQCLASKRSPLTCMRESMIKSTAVNASSFCSSSLFRGRAGSVMVLGKGAAGDGGGCPAPRDLQWCGN